jgi:hypothetical protein
MSGKATKKQPCPDCFSCQWCSDERCRICLSQACSRRRKLSISEQIALYENLNPLGTDEIKQ